jgi:hypothetical protein
MRKIQVLSPVVAFVLWGAEGCWHSLLGLTSPNCHPECADTLKELPFDVALCLIEHGECPGLELEKGARNYEVALDIYPLPVLMHRTSNRYMMAIIDPSSFQPKLESDSNDLGYCAESGVSKCSSDSDAEASD